MAASPSQSPIKVCILAAGYGTRLERDIREDKEGRFKHLIGVPKPLVPIADVPLLTRWTRLLTAAGVSLSDVYVLGNQYNHDMLRDWASTADLPLSNILNDGSTSNDTRLGAVRDLDLLLQQPALADPSEAAWCGMMVIGGDTLFYPDFSLRDIIDRYRATGEGSAATAAAAAGAHTAAASSSDAASVAAAAPASVSASSSYRSQLLYYDVSDPRKYGILELDPASGLVTSFLEKPTAEQTASRKACPCFYVLSRAALSRVGPYVAAAKSLAEVDAPGNLLRHLIALNTEAGNPALLPIEAQPIRGRFDIGGLDTYVQCDAWFREQEGKTARQEA